MRGFSPRARCKITHSRGLKPYQEKKMTFLQKIKSAQSRSNSKLCIGLDTALSNIPEILQNDPNPILAFNKAIIDATKDLACAYKPNIAFYESNGIKGFEALEETLAY